MKLKVVGILIFLVLVSFVIIADAQSLPDYFDWRDNNGNWMTIVKDQGACGSCWAFSAVGTVEAQYNIAKNNPNYNLDLSEENLVANCTSIGDCDGVSLGSKPTIFNYIRDTGLVSETCFPYIDSNCVDDVCGCTYGCSDAICSDRCSDWQNELYRISGYQAVSSNIQEIEAYLHTTGPVSVDMRYASFTWDGEIFRCTTDFPPTHAVIITGYNDTGNMSTSYWIVKNSWGPDWSVNGSGGDGYFHVGFDECSIEDYVYGVNVTSTTIKNIDTENLTISNTGNDNLIIHNIRASPTTFWVSDISETSFTLTPGSSKQISIAVNDYLASPGLNFGNIIITSNDPDQRELNVPIYLIYRSPLLPDSSVISYSFTGAGTETNYIRIPKNATIINASLSVKEVF